MTVINVIKDPFGKAGKESLHLLEQEYRDTMGVVGDSALTPTAETKQSKGTTADFIERLLAGPDDTELTPRELALLEAHLANRRRRFHPEELLEV